MHTVNEPIVVVRSRPGTGLLLLVLAGTFWGTSGLIGTLLNRSAGFSPLAVAAYRLALGGALILALLALRRRPLPGGRAVAVRIVVVGLLAAEFQAAYFTAVALTSVSLATLVSIGTTPVLVLAAETLAGRRRPDRRMAVTVSLALLGLGLLVGLPGGGFSTGAVLASAGLAVLAGAGFAGLTLVGAARPVPDLDELTTTGLGFTVGGLLLLPVAALAGGLGFRPSVGALALLLLLALVPTVLAYVLYFRGLRAVDPGTASVLALLEPLTGALLAAIVLGERLGAAGVLGAVLLATAVVLAGRRRAVVERAG